MKDEGNTPTTPPAACATLLRQEGSTPAHPRAGGEHDVGVANRDSRFSFAQSPSGLSPKKLAWWCKLVPFQLFMNKKEEAICARS